jgi:hypothetical protein
MYVNVCWRPQRPKNSFSVSVSGDMAALAMELLLARRCLRHHAVLLQPSFSLLRHFHTGGSPRRRRSCAPPHHRLWARTSPCAVASSLAADAPPHASLSGKAHRPPAFLRNPAFGLLFPPCFLVFMPLECSRNLRPDVSRRNWMMGLHLIVGSCQCILSEIVC